VLNAENIQTMLKNARGEAGHQSPEDDSIDSDSNQLRGSEDKTEKEQLMDVHMYAVLMHEINNGTWKKPYTETAQENTSIKRASLAVFNLMHRMPQTIHEYAAAAKVSGEKWKHIPSTCLFKLPLNHRICFR
jgi:hypothetical protein